MTSPATASAWSTPFEGDLTEDLQLALRLADAADAVTMSRFDATDLDVRVKADASHVTEADLATERVLRERRATGCTGRDRSRTRRIA